MATSWPISEVTGATAQLEVSIAWGADLTADPDTWVWTEVTGDVMDEPGMSITRGRGDEASNAQPATLSLELDNRSGDYSVGGESSNWPNVRQGAPVRVRVNHDGAGLVTLFQGSADGFSPEWPYHAVPRVKLSASGTLRRLAQGQAPFQSSMRREVSVDDRCLIYWPCEDGDRANAFFTAKGPYFMNWDTKPDLQADDFFECSKPLPKLQHSKWSALVPPASTGDFMFRFLIRCADDLDEIGPDASAVVTLFTSGTAGIWVLRFFHGDPRGTYRLAVYTPTLGLLYESTEYISYVTDPEMGSLISISGHQVGADIEISYAQSALLDESANTFGFTDTLVGYTCGNLTGFWINGLNELDDVTIGHIAAYDEELSFLDGLGAARGWRSEYADSRLIRLEEETGEAINIGGTSYVTMGAQEPATLIDLLREIEQADGGVLYDGETHGLSYETREQRENRAADLTIDATGGELLPQVAPVHDDQRIRNRAYVTRKSAGTFMAEDDDGPLGTDVIGTYDTSVTASLYDDNAAVDLAGWIVHLGTIEGYRYPTVTVNLGAHPNLIEDTLALKPGHRIDITNLDSALTSHPGPSTLSLAVEGMTHRLSAMSWTVVFKCSRYDPWNVIELDDDFVTPISLVSVGADTVGNNTSVVVSTPPTYAGDDLIILMASIRNSGTGTVNTPAGWTPLYSSGNVAFFGWCEAREWFGDGALSDTTVSFTGGVANATTMGTMFAVRGTAAHRLENLADVVHASAGQLNAAAQNVAMPALTVTEDNCMILAALWKQDDVTSGSNPYGFTDFPVVLSSTTGDDACQIVASGFQTTATSLGANTYGITGGAVAISRGIMLALLPDPTPAPPPQLDTMGSTLETSVSAGATSIAVRTTGAGPIEYVGIGADAVGNNTSVVPALPTGLQTGDLLLINAAIRNSGVGTVSATPPAGWHILRSGANMSLLGRYYAAGVTAPTVTFTGGVANATTQARCFAFRGTSKDIATVIDTSFVALNASAQNIALPAGSVANDEMTWVITAWKQDDWTSVATLTSQNFTEISEASTTTGDDQGMVVQYRIGGQTGYGTFNADTLVVTGGAAAISRPRVFAIAPDQALTWTSDATDFPIDLDIGGIKVTATACSDAFSPQTFTVDAVPVALTAGAPVKLWNPASLSRNQGL